MRTLSSADIARAVQAAAADVIGRRGLGSPDAVALLRAAEITAAEAWDEGHPVNAVHPVRVRESDLPHRGANPMLRIIRTKTLRALRADVAEADQAVQTFSDEAEKWHKKYTTEGTRADVGEAATKALRADLEQQFTGLQAVIKQTSKERDEAHAELEAARAQVLLDAEDRVTLRMLLRAARKQQSRTARVYALFRSGQLHSVHATVEAAEIAAEAEGAPRDGWTSHVPGAALPPAAEVAWRVQGLPLGGAQ